MGVLCGLKKGLLFVISAPAGTGKTTLVKMLTKEFSCVKASISSTTREPRQGESRGLDYDFISLEEFNKRLLEGEFIESAEVFGDYYGTSKMAIEQLMDKGNHVILVIDTQGAMQIKKLLSAVLIFISPPSFQELSRRLGERNTESKQRMHERLERAKKELEMARYYDYNLINDRLDDAYDVLRSIFIAEEHRVRRINNEETIHGH